MNAEELAAAADLMGLLAEAMEKVKLAHYSEEQFKDTVGRYSTVECALLWLRDELPILAEYPSLTDEPLKSFRKAASRVRESLAALHHGDLPRDISGDLDAIPANRIGEAGL